MYNWNEVRVIHVTYIGILQIDYYLQDKVLNAKSRYVLKSSCIALQSTYVIIGLKQTIGTFYTTITIHKVEIFHILHIIATYVHI